MPFRSSNAYYAADVAALVGVDGTVFLQSIPSAVSH